MRGAMRVLRDGRGLAGLYAARGSVTLGEQLGEAVGFLAHGGELVDDQAASRERVSGDGDDAPVLAWPGCAGPAPAVWARGRRPAGCLRLPGCRLAAGSAPRPLRAWTNPEVPAPRRLRRAR